MLCRGVKGIFYRKKEVNCRKDFALIDNQLINIFIIFVQEITGGNLLFHILKPNHLALET